MQGGKLTERVVLKELREEISEYGSSSKRWVAIKSVLAEVKQWKGGRVSAEYQDICQYDAKVIIRYGHGANEDMRVEIEGKDYQINSVIDEKKERITTMLVSRVKND